MYGQAGDPLIIPPGFQSAAPFGTNIGPPNAAFFPIAPECQWDSFLTIGLDGPALTPGALSSIGIDFAAWTETVGISSVDGAIFFMDPDHGAEVEPVVFLQLTVATGSQFSGQASFQGRANAGEDWEIQLLHFQLGGIGAGTTGTVTRPPPPPAGGGTRPPPPAPAPAPSAACPTCTNVALGRPATQSSIGWSGDPNRGVDGDPNSSWGGNSCTHTQNGGEEWWQVDLGADFDIQHVDIWHRSDCCETRLLSATVVVSSTTDYNAGTVCGPVDDHLGEPDETSCNQRGRYVTVRTPASPT